MARRYEAITAEQCDFIEAQQLFFVATATAEGRINLSPKGMDSLRVLSEHRVLWLNVTGSGNETAAHLAEDPRMTLMFCAFEGSPMILRLYGEARAVQPGEADWSELAALLPVLPGARQVIDLRVDLVQSSCGTAVPLYEYQGQREELNRWAEKKGEDGIREYWKKRNAVSLDGRPVKIP